MSLAFVALSRCLGLVKKPWAEKYLEGTKGYLLSAGIWVYSIALISPALFDVSQDKFEISDFFHCTVQ